MYRFGDVYPKGAAPRRTQENAVDEYIRNLADFTTIKDHSMTGVQGFDCERVPIRYRSRKESYPLFGGRVEGAQVFHYMKGRLKRPIAPSSTFTQLPPAFQLLENINPISRPGRSASRNVNAIA